MVIKQFPVFLMEASPDGSHNDRGRCGLLLQAACLVRLGNALLSSSAQEFLVKAVYIDSRYHAHEFTLYQTEIDAHNKDTRPVITLFA